MTGPLITVEQIASPIRRSSDQRKILVALRLNKIGRRARLPDTNETLGMIDRVKHLVRIIEPAPNDVVLLSKLRFDALAGYARMPATVLFFNELEWYASADERLVAMLVHDRTDDDFGWIILGRDERERFRAIDAGDSFDSVATARSSLFAKMKEQHALPDEAFHQGDAQSVAMDFFTPRANPEQLHTSFKVLTTERRYSPAHGLIHAMMRYYEDADGNFVQQFQTTGFDARIWELYLFATFTELGYARNPDYGIPDFIFSSLNGAFGVEATSANPPQGGEPRMPPTGRKELRAYIENYIPIKLARRLTEKLRRNPPYWEEPGMADLPFVIAIQDFHFPGSMQMITSAATEYVFGVRHHLRPDGIHVEVIENHVYGNAAEPSGFFRFEHAENVSAVIINPHGTLPKFNRLGYLARFGDRSVRMMRIGLRRGELDAGHPMPRPFRQIIHTTSYSESWVEGMVVLHNPHALRPLHPALIPGAAHEFLQPDGMIMSILPRFHPYTAKTFISAPR